MAKLGNFPVVCVCSLKSFSKKNIPFQRPGIYAIQNTLNGKVYIGQTEALYRRLRHHVRQLRTNVHNNIYLQRAFNLCGESHFKIVVIEFCAIGMLTDREMMYVSLIPNASLYNLIECSASLSGWNHSEESKSKIAMNSANKEAIIQMDKNGEVIKVYDSMRKAAIENGFKTYVGIMNAANGNVNKAYGFRWEFVNKDRRNQAEDRRIERAEKKVETDKARIDRVREIGQQMRGKTLEEIMGKEVADKMKLRIPEMTAQAAAKNKRRIGQYDLNGNLLKIHESLTAAGIEIAGKYLGRISWACQNNKRTSHGFKWKYYNDESKDFSGIDDAANDSS